MAGEQQRAIVVHAGTPAWDLLAAAVEAPGAYQVSVWFDDNGLKVKINEWTWSPPVEGAELRD
jgi:hypothetical protein